MEEKYAQFLEQETHRHLAADAAAAVVVLNEANQPKRKYTFKKEEEVKRPSSVARHVDNTENDSPHVMAGPAHLKKEKKSVERAPGFEATTCCCAFRAPLSSVGGTSRERVKLARQKDETGFFLV
ncbi:hypothetical protein OUZ56_004634 [Daphnia magna]|uniref:Uncharacterized protein n=1 Tax=Daphnia magna TaxID=35525 RepID=A0ABQ9YQE1_9CRUS|nr:hypothetical protein OUZ56_004634 [Daphnia magna]